MRVAHKPSGIDRSGEADMAHADISSPGRPTLKRQLLDRVYTRGINPVMLKLAGRRWSPWAIVRHVGRRSGRHYATPVLWPRETDTSVRILVAFGADTDWCSNILAAGQYTLGWHGREYVLADPELGDSHGAWRLLRRSRYLTARKVVQDEARRG